MMDVLEPAAPAPRASPREALICSDETPQSRPAPWACFRLAERFGVYPMSRCVKVGDTAADMAEGLNAGMLTVAVTDTGNELGLSADELAALAPAELIARRSAAETRLRDAGAQAVLGSVRELPAWDRSRPDEGDSDARRSRRHLRSSGRALPFRRTSLAAALERRRAARPCDHGHHLRLRPAPPTRGGARNLHRACSAMKAWAGWWPPAAAAKRGSASANAA